MIAEGVETEGQRLSLIANGCRSRSRDICSAARAPLADFEAYVSGYSDLLNVGGTTFSPAIGVKNRRCVTGEREVIFPA